jgi:hypothetical protein
MPSPLFSPYRAILVNVVRAPPQGQGHPLPQVPENVQEQEAQLRGPAFPHVACPHTNPEQELPRWAEEAVEEHL